MNRPTITLALIAKNEEKNIPRLFQSIEGCFDEIVFVDTGSTDKTVQTASEWAHKIGANIEIRHFEWIKDFAAARNESYKNLKTDYVMWLDLDDVLSSREAFIKFRDDSMAHADYWFATYDYAHNELGNPVVSFVRERVIKVSKNPTWKYFLHEGVPPIGISKLDYITTWKVIHKRTVQDIQTDKNRNLSIFEFHMAKGEKLDPRMTFYYGKELFEAGQFDNSLKWLLEASCIPELEVHDRLLAIQYASYAAAQMKRYAESRQISYQGIQLDPTRAEFYISVADSFLKEGQETGDNGLLIRALPGYSAAKKCLGQPMPGQAYAGAVFSHPDAYTSYPRNMISQILMNIGRIDEALEEVEESIRLYNNHESKMIMERIKDIKKVTAINENAEQTQDIVITCPPGGPYEWDEGIYQTRGIGGSETAAVEMAKHLHKITGRPVKIFNARPLDYTAPSGVEYISVHKLNLYFSRFRPFVHIAWRHNIKLTSAPTYLWCHDLLTPTVESIHHFDKIFCLSEFHKRYVMSRQGVPSEKIIVTRNGIEPKRFKGPKVKKNPNKIIFSSSPDRGLERAINVVEEARKTHPDLELHVYYGFDNLYKAGPGPTAIADYLKSVINANPWIKAHGNVTQSKLTEEMKDAAVWLYPTDFLETFCITAIESVLSHVFPIVRKHGALPDTLKKSEKKAECLIVDSDCETPDQIKLWAEKLDWALKNKPWELMDSNPEDYSWEGVAKEWAQIFSEHRIKETTWEKIEKRHDVDSVSPV